MAIPHLASSVLLATSCSISCWRPKVFWSSFGRLGIRGSFFCGQECFKSGCEPHLKSCVPYFFVHLPFFPGVRGAHSKFCNLGLHESMCIQKTHKIVHDLLKPKPAGFSANNLHQGNVSQPAKNHSQPYDQMGPTIPFRRSTLQGLLDQYTPFPRKESYPIISHGLITPRTVSGIMRLNLIFTHTGVNKFFLCARYT